MDKKYMCIMSKIELDEAPISPISDIKEISSYYTNGQTYVHVRQDRFIELEHSDIYKQLLKSQQDLKVAVEALETIKEGNEMVAYGRVSRGVFNFGKANIDICTQALAKLSASTAQQK